MKLEQLEVLMAGYFNEDFNDLWGTLDLFISHASDEERRRLLTEIDHVLQTVRDDRELDQFLENLGSYAYLGEDPAAYRAWLEEIARRVAAA